MATNLRLRVYETPLNGSLLPGLRPLSEDTFARAHAKNERLRILLVDDENSMLDTLSVSLKSAGYGLYPASSGEDASAEISIGSP